MRRTFWLWLPLILLLASCQKSQIVTRVDGLDLNVKPTRQVEGDWDTGAPLHAPDSLRPCCAFGYNIKVELLGIPVPFLRLSNVVAADNLGLHHYNDNLLTSVGDLVGMSSEKQGILYTERGGFIDTAHVRDTADNTLFLFSQISPRLGQAWVLELSGELLAKRIKFNAFVPPKAKEDRYALSAYLAADLAYQMAVWHEISQWYGYRSVPGFSEEISAFSPEDLYSNLLGARLALDLIIQGNAGSIAQFSAGMDVLLPYALEALGAISRNETKARFKQIDGTWWDSRQRIPNKFLVLKRSYDLSNDRQPEIILDESKIPMRISLLSHWQNYRLRDLGEMQLVWPFKLSSKWPLLKPYLTIDQFYLLSQKAESVDKQQLQNRKSSSPPATDRKLYKNSG